MTEWIEVNGAKVEKQFLDENIAEAKSYAWNCEAFPEAEDHSHCIICDIAIPPGSENSDCYYHSKGGWLCHYCYRTFVNV